MGFSTGLAVPLFLFVVTITCDVSLGQSETWNVPQAYAGNGVPSFNNGMMYNGGDRPMGYSGSSAGGAAYGSGPNGGMAFGSSSAGAASYGAGNGDMTFSGSRASAGGGGFDGRAADAGANNGFGGFSAATAGSGGRGFYRGANGNGFGGFASGPSGFAGGAPNNGGSAFGVATAGREIQGFDVAPVGNFTPGSGGLPADNGLGGFVAGQGNAPPAAATIVRVPADYDGGSRVVLPTGAVRNGAFKPGRGRPRKFKPTLLSGGFSLKNSLGYVKNAIKSSFLKLSLPDSLKRVAKCSGLFQSTGFSPSSMYQAYFSLYNDISASHGEMSFLEIGSLAFMEMALGFVKFLQSTPFACLMNIAGSFDYISLIYSLLSWMGCDSLCVAKWTTYMYTMLA